MSSQETDYLTQYRELSKHQAAILTTMVRFKAVCESLSNWRETADAMMRFQWGEVWSDDSMQRMVQLRTQLREYATKRSKLGELYNQLPAESRVGLSPPTALDQ